VRLALAALAVAGLTIGVMVATHDGHSAERAIERRERQKLRHFARLEAAGRARTNRTMQEYAGSGAGRGARVT
tara:strand:+ start:68 stop:286 length:219 start_codon:yes stop_codon:yes gene_type:complete